MLNVGPRNRTGAQGETGPKGEDGATWLFGNSVPTSGQGKVGDFFLKQDSFDVYFRTEDGWEYQGSLKGPKGKRGDTGDKGEQGKPGLNGRSVSSAPARGGALVSTNRSVYNEQLVNTGATTVINTFTVPVNKNFSLAHVKVSGPNIADYFIKLNGAKIATVRTNFEEFDDLVPFENLVLSAADVLTVECYNFRPTNETFNATIVGNLYAVA